MFYLERLPCPVLVTNCNGSVQHTNRDFKKLVAPEVYENMNHYFPPACRIFLQTHAWPLLLKNGEFNELYMQLLTAGGERIPVMTNARISEAEGERVVIWLFFVVKERQRFEAELLKARQYAQETAIQLAKVNTELQHANARLSQYAIAVRTEADQFAHLSLTDPLTDLGNRRALSLNVEQWVHSASGESVGSLLLIDIDFFKQINDRFGHAEGDNALRKLAQQLLKSVRAQDTVVRYGGEEFALWLPNSDREGAKLTAKRVHTCTSQIQVADLHITVSIGISSLAPNVQEVGTFLEQLLAQADAALYDAKANGRNRTVCFGDLE
ncbi:diguanylate cyclase [Pseudomonas psychrophila]|uniref:GGDEF domain-containing protein n=1 Tax=Pseudomonas psychrophila TaxID=122355 RepID=UPI00062A1830|nr:GGDEF domain-containing protein [Pseudomonas psychrophila]KOX65658.1 diguanylate cyclase [Pseudomonas psychrophila]